MIKITVDNREVQKMLRELHSKVKNMRPVMREIAGIMHDAVEENFKAEGRPKWAESKRVKKHGGKTLQDTGKLAASISSKYDNSSAIVGTNKIYAAIHQFGGRIHHPAHPLYFRKYKKGKHAGKTLFSKESKAQYGKMSRAYTINIPARPFLKLTDSDIEFIKNKLLKYLTNDNR